MARLGSWIESHPEGIYVRPADAWIDPSQPKARALGHARPCATMRAAGMARCWRRRKRWRSWRRATGRRSGQPIAYDETHPRRRSRRALRARRPCARFGADRDGAQRRAGGRLRRLQAPPGSDLPVLRAGAVRHLHHRGDVRPAGVPPSRNGQRDRPAAAPAPFRPEPLRAGRRLCAGQGAADHHRAARAGASRADLLPRRDRAAEPALRELRR